MPLSHPFRPVEAPFFDDDGVLAACEVTSQFYALQSKTDMRVVLVRPKAQLTPQGTVVMLLDHDGFAEAYLETIASFATRGYQVVLLECVGQGLSTRLNSQYPRRRLGETMNAVVGILLRVIRDDILVRCRGPFYGVGLGYGGLVLYHLAAERRTLFDRLVLIGPLFGDSFGGQGFGASMVRGLRMLCGRGRVPLFGHGDTSVWMHPAKAHPRTRSEDHAMRVARRGEAHPEVLVGGVSVNFLYHLRRAQRRAFRVWRQMRTPVLCMSGAEDGLSSIATTERLMSLHLAGHSLVIPEGGHDLFLEQDLVQKQLWALIDHFIPGGSDYLFE